MKKLIGLALGVALLSTTAGCIIVARPHPMYVVTEAPPPDREERVGVRAGYVWVKGHWEYRGKKWHWVGGHWQKARNGNYRQGYWDRRGNQYHWVEGSWEGGGAVVTPPPPAHHNPHNPGNVNVTATASPAGPMIDPGAAGTPCAGVQHTAGEREPVVVNGWDCSMGMGVGHHEHAHSHPHQAGEHHHHEHVHPHAQGTTHHHPY